MNAASGEYGPSFLPLTGVLQVGRSPTAGLRLAHATVSRQHATLLPCDGGISVQDHDSRYGTFVNGTRVRTAHAIPGDRIRFGTTVVYRVEQNGLTLDTSGEGLTISAENLAVAKANRMLVDHITFDIQANSFVGILGPSGVGKSTLLNCIASYQSPTRGEILSDGRSIAEDPDAYREVLGHVPQEDIVCSSLTVREHLLFAARLRLPCDTESQGGLIERVLERVGLEGHSEKQAKVLSGGQRKRLSVAIELLKRPRLLLLDEPTSGLDPASEARLMEQLRRVASQGTTVVCTTHLMDNLTLCDRVIAMGLRDGIGCIAYVGHPNSMLSHFGCPNFADLYDRLAQGRFTPIDAQVVHADAVRCPDARESAAGTDTGPRRVSPSAGFGALISHAAADNAWRQLLILALRSALMLVRDPGLCLTLLAQPVVLALLVCLTQFATLETSTLTFFCVVVSIWLGLNNSARDLVRERKHYVRERLAGLRPESYLGSKCLVYLSVGAIQVMLLLLVVALGSRLVLKEAPLADLHKLSWAWYFIVFWLSYACGLGLGLLASAMVRTEEAAVAILPLLIMPQLLLSAVAIGQVNEAFTEPDRAFKPLVLSFTLGRDLPNSGEIIERMSLLCYSRPAANLLEVPGVKGFSDRYRVADLCHLLLLLLITWTLTYLMFCRAERRWLRLIGLS